jgi:hypothetical protein
VPCYLARVRGHSTVDCVSVIDFRDPHVIGVIGKPLRVMKAEANLFDDELMLSAK